MKAKILKPSEAEELGLKKRNKEIGKGRSFGVCCVTKGDKLMEKSIIENNKKELIFMDIERKQELKSRRQFTAYIKQFDKIPKELQNELHN